MASEAQRLIGISLTKIAQSRSHRGGVSLHKNLLVATVLQKARYIFMEEAYNMVHYPPAPVQVRQVPEEELIGLTAEEGGGGLQETAVPEASSASSDFSSCVKCAENRDKENHPPYGGSSTSSELTYLDLDKSSTSSSSTTSPSSPNVLRERSNCLKRRRAVAEWETEEAVQSILPKKSKQQECSSGAGAGASSSEQEDDDSVFLDDAAAAALSESVSKEMEAERSAASTTQGSSAMEIDRITSLVSIFSFSMTGNSTSTSDSSKLNRSVSVATPDLCSAQAKDNDALQQQRPFLAMTV